MGCTIEEAQAFADAYANGFKGISKFKEVGSKKVRKLGYIILCELTGHKTFWWDHERWLERQESMDSSFWDRYKLIKEKIKNDIPLSLEEENTKKMVSMHFKAASKWDRKALNSVTQGE